MFRKSMTRIRFHFWSRKKIRKMANIARCTFSSKKKKKISICAINDLQLFWQRFYACMYVLPKFLRPPSSLCKYAHMHIYEYLWSKFVFIIAISRYLAPRQPTGALFSNYRLHSTGNGQNNWRNWILFETQGLHLKPKCKSNYAVVFLKKNWQVREQLKAIHL